MKLVLQLQLAQRNECEMSVLAVKNHKLRTAEMLEEIKGEILGMTPFQLDTVLTNPVKAITDTEMAAKFEIHAMDESKEKHRQMVALQ